MNLREVQNQRNRDLNRRNGLDLLDRSCEIRYVPRVQNTMLRTAIGFALLASTVVLTSSMFDKASSAIIVAILVLAWAISVYLTEKYVHKYPQRFFTYLLASHLKAAAVMAVILWILALVVSTISAPRDVLWISFLLFTFADGVVSTACRPDSSNRAINVSDLFPEQQAVSSVQPAAKFDTVNSGAVLSKVRSSLDPSTAAFIEQYLPKHGNGKGNGDLLVIEDSRSSNAQPPLRPVALLVCETRINDVHRLNLFLMSNVVGIAMGGYFVGRYTRLEHVSQGLKKRYRGPLYWPMYILHFIWYRALPKIPRLDRLYFSSHMRWLDSLLLTMTKRRNRVLSKAEVWGRLAYCGMQVIGESQGEGEVHLIAQRLALPNPNKRPSYYPVVALEKVALDGNIIRMHKLRTMFPFSEFLQKRIFEDHGLAPSGKIANDFRLTELGKFLRRYWLDEIPQLFDWLLGDIKLVGIRATSRHFLSLYPRNFLELYIRTKPGLIPPIFDDTTTGFDQIVQTEMRYLQLYSEKPFLTDVTYLVRTLTDIVFRGIRSH